MLLPHHEPVDARSSIPGCCGESRTRLWTVSSTLHASYQHFYSHRLRAARRIVRARPRRQVSVRPRRVRTSLTAAGGGRREADGSVHARVLGMFRVGGPRIGGGTRDMLSVHAVIHMKSAAKFKKFSSPIALKRAVCVRRGPRERASVFSSRPRAVAKCERGGTSVRPDATCARPASSCTSRTDGGGHGECEEAIRKRGGRDECARVHCLRFCVRAT